MAIRIDFEKVVDKILEAEGGFVDDPDDLGGITNRGITIASFAAYLGRDVTREEMQDLSKGDAINFYKKDFWDKHRVEEYEPEQRHIFMDMNVNHGPKYATMIMQQAVNTKAGDNVLDVDGATGPATRREVGVLGRLDILVERAMFFANNVFDGSRYARRTSQNKFLRGWFFHRVFEFISGPYEEEIAEKNAIISEQAATIEEQRLRLEQYEAND